MHVCIVSPYDPRPVAADDSRALRGGVEEALDRCAHGLATRGHDVSIVCSADRDGDERAADGVRILRVRRRGSLFRNPIAPLHRHIPRDAQVVHVPATYPLYSDLLLAREAARGRATVLDYHFDVYGTSWSMRAAADVHAALATGTMRRAATRVIAKSLDYARHSHFLSKVPQARLDWVPNGVDVDEFRLGPDERDETILCVGRLVPYKGVDVLVRAMPRIHAASGARLLVAGDGPERAPLEALAAELGAPVAFGGRMPRAALAEAYANARLTVLPSVNSQEAFGIALLESMAAGTPVVATHLPGVREVASLAGLTVPPGDAGALVAGVVRAYRDAASFGRPADIRARVDRRYGWRRVVDRLERVYERAIEETSGKTPRPALLAAKPRRTEGA